MFSQRKRFYQKKSFYGTLFVCLLAFGIWFNADPGGGGEENGTEPAVSVGEQVKSGGTEHGGSTRSGAAGGSVSGPNSGHAGAEQRPAGQNSGGFDDEDGGRYSYGSFAGDADEFENGDGAGNGGSVPAGTYYLLQEDGGYIKLYIVDETGEQQLVRTTDISFSLLSETDQTLFEQGVVKETEDELSDFLENFES